MNKISNLRTPAMKVADLAAVTQRHCGANPQSPANGGDSGFRRNDGRRRIISILAVVTFAFFGLSSSAFAQFGGGNGTSGSPYLIKTDEHLTELETGVNGGNDYSGKYFRLENDILCGSGGIYSIHSPIGKEGKPFKGNFNGNNKKLINLYMSIPGTYVGLFGYIDGAAKIENLRLEDASIKGGSYTGAVVGYAGSNCLVNNCHSTGGTVTGQINEFVDNVGGVVGAGNKCIVTLCSSTNGTVNGKNNTGGVVGYSTNGCSISYCNSINGTVNGNNSTGGVVGHGETIFNCTSTGTVTGENYVGGVAGSGTIKNSHSSCNVNGNENVGGVAGTGTLTTCYSTGNVTGTQYVGGVAGGCNTLSFCYFTGNVSGDQTVGGIVGYLLSGNIVEHCYFTGTASGNNSVGGVVGLSFFGNDIYYCFSTGTVSGNGCVGGIVGNAAFCNILNCYSISEVSGTDEVGGITGKFVSYGVNFCHMDKCAALNPKVSGTTNVGRITGSIYGIATLTNNVAFNGMLNKVGDSIWTNIGADDLDGADIDKETINADGTIGNLFINTEVSLWKTKRLRLPGYLYEDEHIDFTMQMPKHLRLPTEIYITPFPELYLYKYYYFTLLATFYESVEWRIISGSLPTGLILNGKTGEISGTPIPTKAVQYNFTVEIFGEEGSAKAEMSMTVADEVSIDDVETQGIASLQIYPNPTNGQLTIDNGQLTMDNVEIYDVMGRRVATATTVRAYCIRPNETETTIDVSHLMPGVYFLKIDNKTAKFVKQ